MPNESKLVESVHSLSKMLARATDIDEQLRCALQVALLAVESAGGSILLHDPERKQLSFRHTQGSKPQSGSASFNLALVDETIGENEGIAGRVFQSGKPEVVNEVDSDPGHSQRIDDRLQFTTLNLLTVPICFPGGEVVGVLQLVNKRSGAFDAKDIEALQVICSIATLAIQLRSSGC